MSADMSNDEFDRLMKSAAGRALGLTEEHRSAYVAYNHDPEPIEDQQSGAAATQDDGIPEWVVPIINSAAEAAEAAKAAAGGQRPARAVDDDGPTYPPTVPVTDDMRSPLPPRHEVELWHDTTMWNEGFEDARDAITTVAVSTDADRDALVTWSKPASGCSADTTTVSGRTRSSRPGPTPPTPRRKR